MALTAPSEDRELAARMLAGEESAFERFFAAFFPALYRFALTRVGRDPQAAEEITQATLVAALGRMATYRGESALYPWLCTFCRHEVSAYYRRRGRQHAPAMFGEDGELAACLEALSGGSAELPEEILRRQELAALVHAALERLPVHQASALEWKYMHGLPVNEIAGRLKLSAKAAESLLTRAREAFREEFAAVCGSRSAMQAELEG